MSPLSVQKRSPDSAPEARVGDLLSRARTLLVAGPSPAAVAHVPLPEVRQGPCHFPLISGEACSFNPYAWSEYIDPQAGVARLVLGLGARLQDRSGDDFTRVVALGAPGRRPETRFAEYARYAQRRLEVFSEEQGRVESIDVADLMKRAPQLPWDFLASADPASDASASPGGRALTFERLLTRTGWARDLQTILRLLSANVAAPVAMEFTTDVSGDGAYRIALTQCRLAVEPPLPTPAVADVLLAAQGAVVGRSRRMTLDGLICVVPDRYAQLPPSARYEVARLIGRLNRVAGEKKYLLLGPGRWGTTSPELGVPVTFAEINHAAALGEIVTMHAGLTPEVSRGVHVFNELVAGDLLYLAIFPGKPHNEIAPGYWAAAPNRLAHWLPGAERWREVVRVIEARDVAGEGRTLELYANARTQQAICAVGRTGSSAE